jgi:hypothetical protein
MRSLQKPHTQRMGGTAMKTLWLSRFFACGIALAIIIMVSACSEEVTSPQQASEARTMFVPPTVAIDDSAFTMGDGDSSNPRKKDDPEPVDQAPVDTTWGALKAMFR